MRTIKEYWDSESEDQKTGVHDTAVLTQPEGTDIFQTFQWQPIVRKTFNIKPGTHLHKSINN